MDLQAWSWHNLVPAKSIGPKPRAEKQCVNSHVYHNSLKCLFFLPSALGNIILSYHCPRSYFMLSPKKYTAHLGYHRFTTRPRCPLAMCGFHTIVIFSRNNSLFRWIFIPCDAYDLVSRHVRTKQIRSTNDNA